MDLATPPRQPASTALPHRPDIDGLRALAVSLVILHHAGADAFRGGYVGVDVFFVISGFLITSILAREASETGRVSLLSFYERRVRRIIPALFVVLAATTIVASIIMVPAQLSSFAVGLSSTLGFTSNFHFSRQTGYFADPARAEPLLHTWSLAVEEQFYALWPWLIILLVRFRARWALLAIGLASLGIAELQLERSPGAAFYLLPARVCELVVGAAIAVGLVRPPRAPKLGLVLAALGLASILTAAIGYRDTTRFPGLAAMVPALGTGLVILAGPRTPLSKLLGARPVAFTGLVSYSLYLWHWPVLILLELYLGRQLTAAEATAAVAASFVAAVLTWRLVERPFRDRRFLAGTVVGVPRVVALAVAVLVVFLALAHELHRTHGLAFRASPAFLAAQEQVATVDLLHLGKECIHPLEDVRSTACRYGEGPVSMLVWGDSHANHFGPALLAWARRDHFSVQQLAVGGCPPLIGVELFRNGQLDPECRAENERAIAKVATLGDLKTVVLAARWSLYAQTTRAVLESTETSHLGESASSPRTVEGSRRVLERGLERTVSYLEQRGLRVVIVGQVPEYQSDPGRCALRALWNRRTPHCDQPREVALQRLGAANAILERVAARHPGATLAEPMNELCDATACHAATSDGEALYHDFDHLTRAGSERLASLFLSAVASPRP